MFLIMVVIEVISINLENYWQHGNVIAVVYMIPLLQRAHS